LSPNGHYCFPCSPPRPSCPRNKSKTLLDTRAHQCGEPTPYIPAPHLCEPVGAARARPCSSDRRSSVCQWTNMSPSESIPV
ncbi:hypothetical protein KUCAC02_011674, partial [Chaenocephalus aceratus]